VPVRAFIFDFGGVLTSPLMGAFANFQADTGVTMEDAQSVLVAIAPLVGTVRVTAAAGNIVRAVVGAAALAESAVPEQRTP